VSFLFSFYSCPAFFSLLSFPTRRSSDLISIEKLKSLYLRDIHIANLGRVMVEGELLKMEKRWISSQLKSAKERYDELVEESPALLQRVPLKYIASFLRMTPVSLSRIRKEK